MKKLLETKSSWGEYYALVRSGTQHTIFIKAIEWKIFDLLVTPSLATTLAEKMNSHPVNTELFLNAHAGMGTINKKEGLYSNTDKGSEFLVSKNPAYLGIFFKHMNSWNEMFLPKMKQLVKDRSTSPKQYRYE